MHKTLRKLLTNGIFFPDKKDPAERWDFSSRGQKNPLLEKEEKRERNVEEKKGEKKVENFFLLLYLHGKIPV